MIKQALEYIVGMKETRIMKLNGIEYSENPIYQVPEFSHSKFKTTTLKSIVDYLTFQLDDVGQSAYVIHVESPTRVVVTTNSIGPRKVRETLVVVEAELPNIHFGQYLDSETFLIQMQSKFVKTDMTAALMALVGNVKEEAVKSTMDDGVSQTVTAKTGIARVEEVIVPNPVPLKPYRTFIEVDQPESMFVFRMKNGPSMALYEADGGAWKNEAIKNIKSYLEHELDYFFKDLNLLIIS